MFETLPKGNKAVAPADLMSIPIGSIILVGKKRDAVNSHKWQESEHGSVWFVFAQGKAVVISNVYPDGETEDLDWFKPWEVVIIGTNAEYLLA